MQPWAADVVKKKGELSLAGITFPSPSNTCWPEPVPANSVALFRNLKRLKLDVAQHVPIHGNPGPNADFERIVGPVAARAPAAGG